MRLSSILEQIGIDARPGRDVEISGVGGLATAGADRLSYAVGDKYADTLARTEAGAVFVTASLAESVPAASEAVVVDDPELALARASHLFARPFEPATGEGGGVHPEAVVFPGAHLGAGVRIGRNTRVMPGAYIGDGVEIGADGLVHPNAVVCHDTRIGDRCILHPGAVIGSDGFGFAHTEEGEHVRIEHSGRVVIEDDVEIGANTTVDRAVFDETVIRRGSKIDNLVQIAHNVEVGEHSLIASQAGIAGSTRLGRNVVMAAQSGSVGHIHIADRTTVYARGGVTKDTEPGKAYAGFPLMEHRLWLKLQGKLARLLKR